MAIVDAEKELEQKRLAARQAMEGPDWTAKREREEGDKKNAAAAEQLKKSLAEIDQQKTALELEWVKLDDQRKVIRAQLAPVLEREKQAEAMETGLELEEAKTVLAQDKQVIEKKRQTAQAARQEAEKDKWGYQEKLWQLERVIETNTVKYRALLDREDEAKKQLTELHV